MKLRYTLRAALIPATGEWWIKLRHKKWLRGYWVYAEGARGRIRFRTKEDALEFGRHWRKNYA